MKAPIAETTEHRVVGRPPAGEHCFGCKEGPSECLGLRVYRLDDGSVMSLVKTKESHQSFHGIVHGGIVCSYLDEVLSYNTWTGDTCDSIAMTVEMTIKYFASVPVNTEIRVVGDPPRIERRNYYISGRILLPDDTIAATADIHYVKLRPEDERNALESVARTARAPLCDSLTF